MIRFFLFAGMGWTDRHQGLMLACVAACLIFAGAI